MFASPARSARPTPRPHPRDDGSRAAGADAPSPFARPATIAAIAAVVVTGAIFGFFYAWVCSTMWGLDTLDPRLAIEAMNAMNASVRNPAFFPIFFLPPVAAAMAALLARQDGRGRAAALLGAAGILYALGGVALTTTVNVPMNEALMAAPVPTSIQEAAAAWETYSSRWQAFNLLRTVAGGVALVLLCAGLVELVAPRPPADRA